MVYKALLKNNHGATLIYILAAFLIISFIGVTMIKQSHHELKSSSDFSSMTSAEQAARSGIQATESFFNGDNDSTVKLLQKYIDSPQPYWILGDTSTSNRVAVNSHISFASQLVAFSFDTVVGSDFIVSIRVYGYGKDKSRKVALTTVDLDGLGWATSQVTNYVPMAAFRLGGNSDFESNCDFEVTGFTRLSGKLVGNSITGTFNGPFYQDNGSYITVFNGGTWTFKDRTYFGGHLNVGTTVYFDSSVGFQGGIRCGSYPPSFGGSIYHKSRIYPSYPNAALHLNFNKWWNVNNFDLHSEPGVYKNDVNVVGSYLESNCTNVTDTYHYAAGTMNVDSLMGFDTLPGDVDFDTSILNTVTPYYTSGTVDAEDINDLYADALSNGDTLCGGFMVLRPSGLTPAQAMVDGDDKLDPGVKVVIVWQGYNDMSNFIESDSTSNIILFSRLTNSTTLLGGFDYFRGVLYIEGSGFQFQPENPSVIDGATYYDVGAQHYNNSGGGVHYKYNQSVLQEASCMNIFTDGSLTPVVTLDSIIVTAPISCTNLGIQF